MMIEICRDTHTLGSRDTHTEIDTKPIHCLAKVLLSLELFQFVMLKPQTLMGFIGNFMN